MSRSFRHRLSNIISYLIDRELGKAEQEYNHSARFGNSSQRAFDRLRRLSSTLDDLGRTGRRIAASKGLPTDSEWGDQLAGGKGDNKTPSDFDKAELQKGQKVELEHTDDYDIALEIALDHEAEFPPSEDTTYYEELDKMEKKLKDKEADDENMGNQTIGDNPLMSPTNEELPPTGKSLNAPSRRPGPYAKRA